MGKQGKPISIRILTNVKVFYKSGVVKEAYKLKKVKARNSKTTMHRVYETVNDSLGHTILTDNLVSTINRTDPITGEKYTFTYKDRLLINAYRIDKKDTIYQLTDLNNKLDLIGLQSTFNSFSDHKNYNNAILKNAQGTILLALTMNKKGKAIKGKLLTTIHPEIDRIVKDFLNQKIINTTRPFKFKPLKINEVKQYYEMVVPFEFGIKRFYRNPVFYNWYFHQFMFQQFNQLNTRMTF
jgi:hypothetical protein